MQVDMLLHHSHTFLVHKLNSCICMYGMTDGDILVCTYIHVVHTPHNCVQLQLSIMVGPDIPRIVVASYNHIALISREDT